MTIYTIKAIKYCEQTVPGPQMFFMSRWDEWLEVDFYFFVLRRDDGQIILIDCGVRDAEEIQPLVVAGGGWRARFRMVMATQNVPLLLQQEGIDPADVAYVLLSHLHYDHCSNAKLFPNAQFVVARTGWRLTQEPPHPALIPDILFPRDVIDHLAGEARGRLILVDDEAPDFLPGIGAFYVGGHTMCCQAFTVQTPHGLAVFPSDTVFYYANLEQMHPIGLAVDIKQCWVAMERIRGLLRAQTGFLVPPHDPELLRRHPGGIIG